MVRTIRIFATSDLITDQRVQRTATSLSNAGFNVIVTGRNPRVDNALSSNLYKTTYIRCVASNGPKFYLLFNLRIFFSLLFSRFSAVYANDLDTLPGCWLASVIRFKPLIYDSHELFPEVPELIGHPIKKRVWMLTEKVCIKKAKLVFTVSDSVANELHKKYRVNPIVVRNLPVEKVFGIYKDSRPTIIYQGALNVDRGIELAIDMMNYLKQARLIIVGTGDIEIDLRKYTLKQQLFNRVEFTGRLTPENLCELTTTAWLGLSLEEDMGLNYRFALPNKVFDYIAAQVPVLVSDLPEMRKIVNQYGVGIVAKTRDPKELAQQITDLFADKALISTITNNVKEASKELHWAKEEPKLIEPIKLLLK